MTAATDIDWTFFGCAVRARLTLGNKCRGIPPGEAAAAAGVSRTTFWRARQFRPLVPYNFEAICKWLGMDPDRFRRDYWERHTRECAALDEEAMAA